MVFSSIPAYLDSSNWHQQQNHQIIGSNTTNPLFPQPPPSHSTPPPPQPHGGGSIRPGSMSERARMANIPMPETAQKCPRCESTNTKFCYFNNYSLTQPRHFCKTCRRYWTRGGALRSVPVGGGCRRNKRSKSSTASKSPASSDRQTATSSSTSTISAANNMLNLTPPQIPSLRFMSPLGQITDGFNVNGDVGLNYSGISSATAVGTNEMNFHNGLFSNGGVMEPWRLQQVQNFPFLSGLDQTASSGMYQFQGGDLGFLGGENGNLQNRPKFSSSLLTQMASVKMEENNAVNFSRQLLGNMQGNNDQWNTNTAWNEHLSSFSTSSASNNQCRNLELSMENGAFSPRDYGEKN